MSDDLVKRLRVDDPWCQPKCDQAADHIEQLEAKLAKAVEALGNISNIGVAWSSKYEDQIKEAQGIARTTLAELKGETDE